MLICCRLAAVAPAEDDDAEEEAPMGAAAENEAAEKLRGISPLARQPESESKHSLRACLLALACLAVLIISFIDLVIVRDCDSWVSIAFGLVG